jgi:hypothetical protein
LLPQKDIPHLYSRTKQIIISGKLISNDDYLQRLYEFASKISPLTIQRSLSARTQWTLILSGHFNETIILGAPAAFLYYQRLK